MLFPKLFEGLAWFEYMDILHRHSTASLNAPKDKSDSSPIELGDARPG